MRVGAGAIEAVELLAIYVSEIGSVIFLLPSPFRPSVLDPLDPAMSNGISASRSTTDRRDSSSSSGGNPPGGAIRTLPYHGYRVRILSF